MEVFFVIDQLGARITHPDAVIEVFSFGFGLVWVIPFSPGPEAAAQICAATPMLFFLSPA